MTFLSHASAFAESAVERFAASHLHRPTAVLPVRYPRLTHSR